MSIHPTAIVSPDASLGEDVSIGPYAIVEEETVIGARTQLAAHAQVRRGSILGEDNIVGSGALIGADPQFHGFDPDLFTSTRIGNGNSIREYVTIHRSIESGEFTEMGNGNFLMTGSHVGHDCSIGDLNTLANNVLLGGHVRLGNHSFLGGGSVFHQFVRIGDFALAQGLAGMSLDVPPYVIAAGINQIAGINAVGLRRAGFEVSERKEIKEAFRLLYRSGKSIAEVLRYVSDGHHCPAAQAFFDFLSEKSKKGVCSKFGSP